MKQLLSLFLLCSFLLVSGPVRADSDVRQHNSLVFEDQIKKIRVELTDVPCDIPEVLAQLKEEYKPLFHDANTSFDGVSYPACWAVPPGDTEHIFIIDVTGDSGTLPMTLFAPKDTI